MPRDYRIEDVRVSSSEEVVLALRDGQQLRVSLRGYPRLVGASDEALRGWRLVDDGHGLAWPDLADSPASGAVNVYPLLWDRLYDAGLARLAEAHWELAALSDRHQQLVALWRLEADINNGGFMQFLCNWGDETCQLALRALEAIDAKNMLAIVQRMRGILSRLEDDPSIVELTDLYAARTDEEVAEMAELDRAFWAYPDDLARLGLRHFGCDTPSLPAR